MPEVFICDCIRTPIGKYGGTFSTMCIGIGQGIAIAFERA